MVVSDDRIVEVIHRLIVHEKMQQFLNGISLGHRWLLSKNAMFNRKIKFSTILGISFCVFVAQFLLPIIFPTPIAHHVKPITRDVFIYATFMYKNSTSFDITGQDTFVLLLLANREDNFPFMRCALRNAESEPVMAQLKSYDYTKLCNLIMFVAVCNFPLSVRAEGTEKNNNNEWRHHDGRAGGVLVDMGTQVLANDELRRNYADMDTNFFELVVREADRTPRNLVICVSRIFAFEKWQLLLTAMEMYKALGVDLVVVHIVSALSAVFKLIKAYEAEGRLAIRKGFKLPILKAMNFDPEMQVEYSGQLAMAHECFFEFRESAKFISMLDLDDLLITTKFASLNEALNAASLKYPMAPYFYVNKLESGILLAKHTNGTKMTAKNFMHKSVDLIYTKTMYNSEKIVLRPHKIDAFWVHFTYHFRGKHKPVQLSTDYMTILHLSKDINATNAIHSSGYKEKLLPNISNSIVSSDFIKESTINTLIDKMPTKLYYFDAIRHCARFINNYPNFAVQINSPCLSYKLCHLPKTKVDCTVTRSKYYTKAIPPTKIYRVHVLQKSFFVNRKGGCFYRKLIF